MRLKVPESHFECMKYITFEVIVVVVDFFSTILLLLSKAVSVEVSPVADDAGVVTIASALAASATSSASHFGVK